MLGRDFADVNMHAPPSARLNQDISLGFVSNKKLKQRTAAAHQHISHSQGRVNGW